jgi:hypothetical protein
MKLIMRRLDVIDETLRPLSQMAKEELPEREASGDHGLSR